MDESDRTLPVDAVRGIAMLFVAVGHITPLVYNGPARDGIRAHRDHRHDRTAVVHSTLLKHAQPVDPHRLLGALLLAINFVDLPR